LSNKKLTTSEKETRSKQYAEDMQKLRERLESMKIAKKKIDEEIADERHREYLVNMQEVGAHATDKIGSGFTVEEYKEIIDYFFTVDEVIDFVMSERARKAAAANSPMPAEADTDTFEETNEVKETESEDENRTSDEGRALTETNSFKETVKVDEAESEDGVSA